MTEGKSIEIKDTTMFYMEHGQGRPVVLVHGNTGSSRWWSRVMDLKGCRVLAPELPNFGRSGRLGVADIDVYADYLGAFLGKLGLVKPVLVGHSLGGAVVMSLLARRPELAGGLVIVDGAAPGGLKTPEEHYPIIELYRTNRGFMRKALAAVTPTLTDEAFLDGLADDAMLMAPHAYAGNARALEKFDYRGRTSGFTGPVLVVWGKKDIIITEAMARATATAYPSARLELLDDVGHSVMVEDPARFKTLMLDFISSLE